MLAAMNKPEQSLQGRKKGFRAGNGLLSQHRLCISVAIVAEIAEDGRSVIAGGERYIVVQPGQAEIAFVVVDAYRTRVSGRS